MRPATRARWLSYPVYLLGVALVTMSVPACGTKGKTTQHAANLHAPDRVFPTATPAPSPSPNQEPAHKQTESYERIFENPYYLARQNPLSTFSIDVDTASYSLARRFLNDGQLPPRDAVRIEEFLNYFSYDYPAPKGEHPVALAADVARCPWHDKHQLVRIGVQGKHIAAEDMPPRNLVFLVDTSGSMDAENRLPLLKSALRLLTRQLTAKDRVAIVAYAGSAGLVLDSTPGNRHEAILEAINRLSAGGSTNGGEGIVLAYRVAQQHFITGGANRVILGTDGDFNVGVTSEAELVRLIETKRSTGVFLSVLGFGMGNYKDPMLQKLAQHGNGQHAFIDSFAEAKKVFVQDLANLVPIAKDVKIQVEFNPALVQAYRLIGYENRLLRDQDFNDDKKDAGDMGAGHTVTALYEIVPPGVEVNVPSIDDLKYQKNSAPAGAADSAELLTVKLRYILPEESKSRLLVLPLKNSQRDIGEASADFRFAAAVASFGLLLRQSEYKGTASYAGVLHLARDAAEGDMRGQRREFVRLVNIAQQIAERNRR